MLCLQCVKLKWQSRSRDDGVSLENSNPMQIKLSDISFNSYLCNASWAVTLQDRFFSIFFISSIGTRFELAVEKYSGNFAQSCNSFKWVMQAPSDMA